MKVAIVAVVAALLGVGAGLARTMIEFGGVEERFEPFDSARSSRTTTPNDSGPKLTFVDNADEEVAGSTVVHNFDVMERNTRGSHTFKLKNSGRVPLELMLVSTTCKCASTTLKEDKLVLLAPGEQIDVPLEWTPKTFERNFRQSAEFKTNDPNHSRFHLVIEGRVTMSLRPEPDEIVLGDIPVNEPRAAELRIFCYTDQTLQYEGHGFTEPETAEFFDLKVEPLPAAQVQKEPDARSGLLARLLVSPDIPLGPIQQTLRLHTNVKSEGAGIEIPIAGKVIGDIFIHTQATYDDNRRLLHLPIIKKGEGHRVVLRLGVSGRYKDEIEVSVDEQSIDPQGVLLTSWGRTIRAENGPTTFPLIVEIPRDADVVSRLGPDRDHLGKIVINTTHPDAEKIVIYVRFAIEP